LRCRLCCLLFAGVLLLCGLALAKGLPLLLLLRGSTLGTAAAVSFAASAPLLPPSPELTEPEFCAAMSSQASIKL
jgi:hypothetical protein